MLSNPAVLPTVCLLASLEIHNSATVQACRRKSQLLTYYLEKLITQTFDINENSSIAESPLIIISPYDIHLRGCQLSLLFNCNVNAINDELERAGVCCDVRKPNVIRISPTPLYNSFQDVYYCVQKLKFVMEKFNK